MNTAGVKVIDLKPNTDARGSYTEMYHDTWEGAPKELPQWSVVHSKQHAIRGMRIHLVHSDYVCLCQGEALYITKDLRKNSPTFGLVEYYDLSAQKLQVVITPPGVAHGFYFKTDAIFVVGITHPYDPQDELGFFYADPEAGITLPQADYIVSERDLHTPPVKDVLSLMPEWQATT